MKTITISVKDASRFCWGINEFYPLAKIRIVSQFNDLTELEISYVPTTPRDGIAGYCRGFRDY